MDNDQQHNPSASKQRPQRVTHKDIAKALGLSKATISLAMRNHPRLPEATRQRVHKKAEELGYRPDPVLSALSNYRSAKQEKVTVGSLAWINFYQNPQQLREKKFFNLYWKGAHEAAKKLGFNLEEFKWKDLSLHRMHTVFKARGIRGIVLPPSLHTEAPTPAELETFPWQDYAIIRLGESLPSLKVNFVSSAQVSNTILMFEKMRAKGYERIGFIGINHRKRLFSAGYLWAQQTTRPKSQQLAPLLVQMEESHQLEPRLTQWLQQQKPDAIICGIESVCDELNKLGYTVPNDFGLASMNQQDSPINAGIDEDPEAIGATAISYLVSQLNQNNFGLPSSQKEILIKGKWVDGSMLPDRTA